MHLPSTNVHMYQGTYIKRHTTSIHVHAVQINTVCVEENLTYRNVMSHLNYDNIRINSLYVMMEL